MRGGRLCVLLVFYHLFYLESLTLFPRYFVNAHTLHNYHVILRIIIRAYKSTLSERASTLANSIWTKPGTKTFPAGMKGGESE